MLPPVYTPQFGLLHQCVVWTPPPQAMLVGQKPVVKDRIEPTPQIPLVPMQVPAGKGAFKGVLNEVVGRLPVASQQRAGETAQPANLRFDQRCSVRHSLTVSATAPAQPPQIPCHRQQCPLAL